MSRCRRTRNRSADRSPARARRPTGGPDRCGGGTRSRSSRCMSRRRTSRAWRRRGWTRRPVRVRRSMAMDTGVLPTRRRRNRGGAAGRDAAERRTARRTPSASERSLADVERAGLRIERDEGRRGPVRAWAVEQLEGIRCPGRTRGRGAEGDAGHHDRGRDQGLDRCRHVVLALAPVKASSIRLRVTIGSQAGHGSILGCSLSGGIPHPGAARGTSARPASRSADRDSGRCSPSCC